MQTTKRILGELFTVKGLDGDILEKTVNRLEPDCSVLDLGCGEGAYSIKLAKLGFNVTAVDKNEESIKILKELTQREGLKITTIQADVTKPEELSQLGKFDVIVSTNLLQELPNKQIETLVYWSKTHTNYGGYNIIETFDATEFERGPYVKSIDSSTLSKILRTAYLGKYSGFVSGEEDYLEYWSKLEQHPGEQQHRHYLIQLIAKNIRPSHWRQYGSNLSREE